MDTAYGFRRGRVKRTFAQQRPRGAWLLEQALEELVVALNGTLGHRASVL